MILYDYVCIWVFPKIGSTPKWMVKIMEDPIKMDDLGVPLFLETSIYRIGSGNSQRIDGIAIHTPE